MKVMLVFYKEKRSGFTLVELLVVIAIIGILIGMLLPAVQQVREAARRSACSNQMRQMTLGMMNFESASQHFPSGNATGEGDFATTFGQHGLNWSCLILPFIEQNAQFDVINQLTDNLANPRIAWESDAAADIIPTFICPSCPMEDFNTERSRDRMHGKSNYVGIWGVETNGNSDWDDLAPSADVYDETVYSGILFLDSEVSFGEITDGSSNTFIIGERDGGPLGNGDNVRAAATWCASEQANWLNQSLAPCSREPDYTINTAADNNPSKWNSISSQHSGGAMFGRADGSVNFVTETIDGDVYEALATKNFGEIDQLN